MNKTLLCEHYCNKADAHLQSKRYDLMLVFYKKALRIAPTDRDLNNKYFQALKVSEKLPQAEVKLRMQIQIMTKEKKVYETEDIHKLRVSLGDLLLEQGKNKEGKEQLQKELKKYKCHSQFNDLGIRSVQEEKYEKAKIYFEMSLKGVYPYSNLNCLGYCYFQQGNFEAAIKVYKRVLKKKSNYYLSYINWTLVLICTGKNIEAKQVFKQGIKDASKYIVKNWVGIYTNELKRAEKKLENNTNKKQGDYWQIKYHGIKIVLEMLEEELKIKEQIQEDKILELPRKRKGCLRFLINFFK